ncbi:type II toxin-antitoxin system VapC family toxin [Anabaena sp. FACHB-1237]|uniref:type II toxin-antitoxin system VapC family toxin n=1 Tax=Anabaena sp. FACHB-1237 TaxID=2692769 RepID=UPI001681286D|nr:PIN domain-containing protein [Anabaena sp. FACHB-1237]MBD2136937.1 type II toxin-antitoxin system VapC family toxin [Anabaena sp. FACHB-1237]
MSIYILDTNIVTLFQHKNTLITQRIWSIQPSSIFITVVTFQEQLEGRLKQVNSNSQKTEKLISAYRDLRNLRDFYSSVNLLDFNEGACEYFKKLRQQKINTGTQDLRIAAIALVNNAILVTQNSQDFNKVPDLKMEDWSKYKIN